MIKHPLLQLLLLGSAIALFVGAGCQDGRYTDKEGESFGGGIDADLAYPLPSPTPPPKPVDRSK